MAEITRAMKPGRKLLASVLLVWDEHEVKKEFFKLENLVSDNSFQLFKTVLND